jgi:hypothetical protein
MITMFPYFFSKKVGKKKSKFTRQKQRPKRQIGAGHTTTVDKPKVTECHRQIV